MIAAVMMAVAMTVCGYADPEDALGRRIMIEGATVFVPEGRVFGSGPVDVLIHLHGAAGAIEPAFVAAGWPGVLVEFNRKGLSSVYTAPFRDPTLLPGLIARAMEALRREGIASDPRPGRLVVSSFSAGFGGVREILRNPADVAAIDAVVLADSLYCGYEGEPGAHRVDPALMAPFRRFAEGAARGETVMVLTHSAQVPGGYASTTETADDLIACVDAKNMNVPDDDAWPGDFRPARRLARGRFVVLGFGGEGPEDHLRHLRRIGAIWAEARGLLDRPGG